MTSPVVYYHPSVFLHDAEARHVAMHANRVRSVFQALADLPGVVVRQSDAAQLAQLTRVHDAEYLSQLSESAKLGPGQTLALDGETVLNRHTWDALLHSAGAVCQAVDSARRERAFKAFCAVYAGHHARPALGHGFCFVNSVAVGAFHALNQGFERVAVLDFDTHSGDGTVLAVLKEPRVFFAETYQPGFPGAFLPGYCPENVFRRKVTRTMEFRSAWQRWFGELEAFEPDLVLVSAGFDAHKNDPLSQLQLQDEDYEALGRQLGRWNVPVVCTLEGGYSVPDTSRCAALFFSALCGLEK